MLLEYKYDYLFCQNLKLSSLGVYCNCTVFCANFNVLNCCVHFKDNQRKNS